MLRLFITLNIKITQQTFTQNDFTGYIDSGLVFSNFSGVKTGNIVEVYFHITKEDSSNLDNVFRACILNNAFIPKLLVTRVVSGSAVASGALEYGATAYIAGETLYIHKFNSVSVKEIVVSMMYTI